MFNSKDADRLRGVVSALEQTERLIVLLFYADDLTTREISMVLDVSMPRVESTLTAVREQMRQALQSGTAAPAAAKAPAPRRAEALDSVAVMA